ncbi:MAG: hypothetical protein QXI19_01345 [Candidatus Caldarchaeum sp.]
MLRIWVTAKVSAAVTVSQVTYSDNYGSHGNYVDRNYDADHKCLNSNDSDNHQG